MKFEEFKKGIKEFQETRLTSVEKSAMLQRVLETPVISPYWSGLFHKPAALALLSAFLLISGSATAYSAHTALPGDLLYPIKVQVLEPILDQVHTSPLEKLEWEEEKIERRIREAEALAKDDKLDESKTRELEKKIEKSSAAFSVAAERVGSSTNLKKALSDKLKEKKSSGIDEAEKEKEQKVQRLKDKAVRALEKHKD